jgi:hypothetical protein
MKHDYPIAALCEILEASVSGFYDWQKRRSTPPNALRRMPR